MARVFDYVALDQRLSLGKTFATLKVNGVLVKSHGGREKTNVLLDKVCKAFLH